jgi:hypothetical protein
MCMGTIVWREAGSIEEEAGSGHEDSSHNILTLDALQVLSRSQVTPGLSMSMRRPICKVYIHAHTGLVQADEAAPATRLHVSMMNVQPVRHDALVCGPARPACSG